MSELIELKPCPFCGREATFWTNADTGGEYAACQSLSCKTIVETYSYDTKEKAAKVWNNRAK